VRIRNPIKVKQLYKGLQQLGEEGAVQVYKPVLGGDLILGAVGANPQVRRGSRASGGEPKKEAPLEAGQNGSPARCGEPKRKPRLTRGLWHPIAEVPMP
jgi:hypothetical protein